MNRRRGYLADETQSSTSPSLYVVYSTLRAIQGNDFTCYGGGTTSVAAQGQQLGANYTSVTRAYAPGVIKSGHCYHGTLHLPFSRRGVLLHY